MTNFPTGCRDSLIAPVALAAACNRSNGTAQQRQQQQEPKYRGLLWITGQVVQSTRQVVEQTKGTGGIDVMAGLVIDQLRRQITSSCDLADRVIDQTRRRVSLGEQVPSEQKVYSIFEPHTDLIKRGKVLKPVEFGHKVFLAESAQGLIADYRFANRKAKHCDSTTGLYPFVLLLEAEGEVYPKAENFLSDVAAELDRKHHERTRFQVVSLSPSTAPAPLKTIDTFRSDAPYGGDGNRIDLAYAIYAFAHGIGIAEVSAAIRSRDLSHKGTINARTTTSRAR